MAARLDDRYELVAGALSSDAGAGRGERGRAAHRAERSYADFARDGATRGGARRTASTSSPSSRRTTCTRRIASAFLDAGIHVICDKPLTTTLAEALALVEHGARARGALFALTHNYSGYPMVRQAREMVAAGELGEIRVVQVEYPQDWLSTDLEATGQKQAAWRIDPAQRRRGRLRSATSARTPSNLARFITGLELAAVSADLHDASSPAAGSTTTRTCCCATRMARAACCGRARSRRATRTRCACASTAARPGSTFAQEHPNQLLVHAAGRAAAADHPRRRRRRRGGGARDAHPGRPSRGLPRRLRPALPRRGRADPGALGTARARPAGVLGADRRGRRARHEVHRGGGRVEPRRRPLDRRAPALVTTRARPRCAHVRRPLRPSSSAASTPRARNWPSSRRGSATRAWPWCTVDVSTSAGGARLRCRTPSRGRASGRRAAVFTGERGSAVAAMAQALVAFLLRACSRRRRRDRRRRLGRAALVSPAMQALPVGCPKLLVCTLASGDVARLRRQRRHHRCCTRWSTCRV